MSVGHLNEVQHPVLQLPSLESHWGFGSLPPSSRPWSLLPLLLGTYFNLLLLRGLRDQICRGAVTNRGKPSAQAGVALGPLAGRKKGCFVDSGFRVSGEKPDSTARSRFPHDSHGTRKQFRVR